MKKYLSKKYIKYIGSLCVVWAALWNVFLLGVSLENSGPAADSTLLQCILGSENYAHDFFTRQYTGAVESLCGILILIVLNTVTELVVRKKIKIMDLC